MGSTCSPHKSDAFASAPGGQSENSSLKASLSSEDGVADLKASPSPPRGNEENDDIVYHMRTPPPLKVHRCERAGNGKEETDTKRERQRTTGLKHVFHKR
jgi:hypothetical protein